MMSKDHALKLHEEAKAVDLGRTHPHLHLTTDTPFLLTHTQTHRHTHAVTCPGGLALIAENSTSVALPVLPLPQTRPLLHPPHPTTSTPRPPNPSCTSVTTQGKRCLPSLQCIPRSIPSNPFPPFTQPTGEAKERRARWQALPARQ